MGNIRAMTWMHHSIGVMRRHPTLWWIARMVHHHIRVSPVRARIIPCIVSTTWNIRSRRCLWGGRFVHFPGTLSWRSTIHPMVGALAPIRRTTLLSVAPATKQCQKLTTTLSIGRVSSTGFDTNIRTPRLCTFQLQHGLFSILKIMIFHQKRRPSIASSKIFQRSYCPV